MPPETKFLQSKEARKESLDDWKQREVGKRQVLVEKAQSALLEAQLAREQVTALREQNSHLAAQNARLFKELDEAYAALDLTKDEKSSLRKLDVSRVAERLGFFGVINPKENAIDLVKRINTFSFEQACAWLHAEFGSLPAQAIAETLAEVAEANRPFTPAENVIKQAISKQVDALGCNKFRLTLIPADEEKKPFLPGKPRGKNSEERFYNRDELIELIPWLRFRNNNGDGIIVTPMDDHAYYILLDDARVTLEQMRAKGFEPCLVQRTSWEKEQMVFKVPKTLPREEVLAFFNDLNRRIGDPEINGLRHGFRLAGFRNNKLKHERDGLKPFVEIKLAVNRFCAKCTELINRQLKTSHSEPEPPVLPRKPV